MLGNFTFHNPTKLYFGENSLENLGKELGKYGEKVMLVYGGGSIRKNGIYDTVLAELRKVGKQTRNAFSSPLDKTVHSSVSGMLSAAGRRSSAVSRMPCCCAFSANEEHSRLTSSFSQ